MKKISLILCMFLIMYSGLSGIKYGVKGGFNIAHFSNLTFLSKDMTTLNGNDFYIMNPDYSLGLFTSFEFSNYLSFQTELLYSSKSVKFQFSDDTSVKFNLKYIEVPFFLKYSFKMNNSLFPYLYGGLYYSAVLDSIGFSLRDLLA